MARDVAPDPTSPLAGNALALERELQWFTSVVDTRFKLYFDPENSEREQVQDLPPPDLSAYEGPYARFVTDHDLDFAERLTLAAALVPHLRPSLLDAFFLRNKTFDRRFTEFGGVVSPQDDSFWPTPETVAFLLGGSDLSSRFSLARVLDADHVFAHEDILTGFPADGAQVTPAKAPLWLSDSALSLFTVGQVRRPRIGAGFPAQFIKTALNWDDLVLHPGTRAQVDEITTWIEYGETLLEDWGMRAKLRAGHRALFHGPPGTGKTMTACLLGKSCGRDVYRVDLSMVVSKYIGETQKNLARVFDTAQSRGWILFFDEGESIFGKRSETRDAHDRYANQEISYLLARVEVFDGVVILASNLRENLDDAFMRRFESVVYFPMPSPAERARLWRQGFSRKAPLDPALDLDRVAEDYSLSGGSIMNVIRHVSLESLRTGERQITRNDIVRAIGREMAKEGRSHAG